MSLVEPAWSKALRGAIGALARHRGRRNVPGLALVLSFLLLSIFPLLHRTPLATLRTLTDHLRHPHVVRVALERGFAVYTEPFGVVREGIAYPYPSEDWLDVAYVYPPGALLVYLPATLLGMTGALSHQNYAIAIVLYLLALAHVSIWRVARVAPPVITLLAWLALMQQALNGEFDVVWIGAAAVAFERLRDERPESAMRWICVAALFHFRAFALAPAGAYALSRAVAARGWPWRTLALVTLTGATCGAAFIAMAPFTRADLQPIMTRPTGEDFIGVIAVTATAAVLMWRLAGPWTAAAIILVGAFSVTDVPHWWHATVMLPIPLGIGVLGRPRHMVAAVLLGIAWYVPVQIFAWHSNPLWLFRDIFFYLRG
jgi:hypothetical protein